MKKKFLLSILSIFIISSITSCSSLDSIESNSENISEITQKEDTFKYPFTGIKTNENPQDKTPYIVVVENSKASRPQSGLSFADIVYETSAEGGIPRFIAIYHSNTASKIGPVRSIRPYFLTISKEYALPIAHCGGSKEALNEVKKDSSIMSINEMTNGKYYYRDNNRKAPHNLYTSSEKILQAIKDKKYNLKAESSLKFDNEFFNNNDLKEALNITIKPNNVYETSYTFEDGTYTKLMDGEIAKDAITNSPLTFTNIVVQKTDITLQTDNSHLNIDLVSSGEGYIFSNGKVIEMKWSKDSQYDDTKLYDLDGNPISLSEGNTIWNIVDSQSIITY
ncbi:DUF3048 domain-containing protein [Clostridium sp.]|uniref:DUF3048 domain-containing protein n=1 Tax=Clostridium sp. TaxID=1506 RepID=UPI002A91A61C|nr:DUF3048 domain-containing protein [Clostridium sp.]MDY6011330.1 DUF3048 domain-containing protein [Clostridium sp.]